MKLLMIDSLTGNDYSICLCNSLKKAGVDVYLTATVDREITMPVNFSLLAWAPTKTQSTTKIKKTWEYFIYNIRILYFIFKNNIDVVHYQFFRRQLVDTLFFLLLRLFKINLIYTAHNVLPHENHKFHYILNSIVYRSSTAIIAHSNYIKNLLKEIFQFNFDMIVIIPHGNFNHYKSKKNISQTDARKKLNLLEEDNVLLFFGFIRKYKGLDLLLDAFEKAVGQNKNLKLVIAGEPINKQLETEYRERIAQIPGNDKIQFFSDYIPNDQIAPYFIASDIVALPYKNIYHSGLMHLAYSFGKPIIATSVGDFSETIEQGKNGFILKKNDATNLAKTIISAFADKNKLKKMGKYVTELNENKYSWDKIAYQTKRLYEKVLTPK